MAPLKLFVACLCLCMVHVAIGQNVLKLGILTGFPIDHNISLYDLAVDYLKARGITPPGVDIELVYTYVSTDSSLAAIAALDMVRVYNVTGVIGSFYSSQSANVQIMLRYYKVPQVSDYSSSISLSNKNSYPYFLRTFPPDFIQARALVTVAQKFGWKNVVFVYTSDDYGIGGRDAFTLAASNAGITTFSIALTVGRSNFTSEVASVIQTKIHAIVVFAQKDEALIFMRNANQTGIVGPDYAYVFTETIAAAVYKRTLAPADYALMNGMIGLTPHGGIGPVFEDAMAFANQTRNPSSADLMFTKGHWYSFDIVYLYVLAVSKLLSAGYQFSEIKNSLLLQTLINTSFVGATGAIKFDQNGDRMGYYDLINCNNNQSFRAGLYSPETQNITMYLPVIFYDNTTRIPIDKVVECGCIHGRCSNGTCICEPGWSGVLCSDFAVTSGISKTVIIAIVVPIVFVGALLGVVVYNVYQRKRKRLLKNLELNQRSKVKREELTLQSFIGRGAMGDVFRATMRGSEVAVKRIIAHNMNKTAIENYKLETAMMCTLRHPNLVLFMGSCRDKSTNEMFLVMELLTRGSLHNVLHNKNISLSFEMCIHIATQAAQGMDFLHQSTPPIIHRDMKSHNILLDEKWNAKISDFGLTKTKENVKRGETEELGTLFWTAPEVLQGLEQTEKSDIYAFGIILWEIFHRDVPYGDRNPWAVALDVIAGVRPDLDDSIPYEVIDLMKKCWNQEPLMRPSAAEIVRSLRGMSAAHLSSTASDRLSKAAIEPPVDTTYLVATEVVGSAKLWEDLPNEMFTALQLHNKLMRELIKKHFGYEVYFKDTGFFAVFAQPLDAINFCLAAQINLLSVAWPSNLDTHKASKRETGTDSTLLRSGLRVKMIVHVGKPEHIASVEDGRVHYFGPSVDKLKVYLANIHQAEVIVTSDVMRRLEKEKAPLMVPTMNVNAALSSGPNSEEEMATQILPITLKQRLASASSPLDAIVDFETPGGPTNADNHPYAVIDMEDRSSADSSNPSQLKFSIPQKNIAKGESIGRGTSGEAFLSQWNNPARPGSSQQVVLKVFVAQGFYEVNVLKLVRNVSLMSKLNHTNIVQVYGACFEQGHVALVTEYVPRGSLRRLLSDNTVQLDANRKLQFLRDIAAGLNYLSKQDSSINQHKDLKSTKILVTNEWNAKVGGYGLDVVRDALRTMTSVQAAPWTAPEVWTEKGLDNYESVSVYAFGIIMWEILTRQIAFEKVHPIKLCRQVIAGDRPPIPSSCSEAYSHLMQACWASNPSDRPNFTAILQELNRMHTV